MKLSFSLILFLIFLVLKLTEEINWSWWWVTSPVWVPLLLGLIIVFLVSFVKEYKADKWRKNIKVGDWAKYQNALNGWTVGQITMLYRDGTVRIEAKNYSATISRGVAIDSLYPAKPKE